MPNLIQALERRLTRNRQAYDNRLCEEKALLSGHPAALLYRASQ
jgi:hypothetical protein